MRSDLKRLQRDTGSGRISTTGAQAVPLSAPEMASSSASVTAVQPAARPAHTKYIVAGGAVLLVAIAFALYHFKGAATVPSGLAKITQISQWNKPMRDAHLSPDGHAVAFDSEVGGIAQIFLMLISGGEPLQLTNDEGDKFVDNFSPDGKEVYYRRFVGRDEIWAVPALGGSPRRLVSARHLVSSPDGNYIYYSKHDDPGIFRVEKSELNEELVYNPDGTGLLFIPLLLFPGGNDLLASGGQIFSPNPSHIFRVNVASHKAVDLGEVPITGYREWSEVVWAEPGNSILFSRTINGLTNIWKHNLKDRSLTQITSGTGPDYSPMPDMLGKGIYYVNGKSSGFLTTYNVQSKQSTDIVSEDATQPAISPDGKRVMYIALLAPKRTELWVSDIDGGNRVKLAAGQDLATGTWAPDNFHLTFHEVGASTAEKVYIVGADGSGLRPVPPMNDRPWTSVWSSNQKTVFVSALEKGGTTINIWKWDVDGSNPEKVVDKCCLISDADPSGKYLLGSILIGEKIGIYEVSLSDRKCIPLLPGVVTFGATFARDGKSFLYAVASRGEVTIYRQSWSDGKLGGAPQVALKIPFAFPIRYFSGNAYDFSQDLSTVVYARPGGHADLYLLSQK